MNNHKIKILAFGAHPDDVEMSCAGTLMKQAALGHAFGIIDLTRGELGTRGSAEIRETEAMNAGKIIGTSFRENLNFKDGFFINDKQHQLEVIRMIRKYQPEIVFANAVTDRHPDHGKGADLVRDAAFLSGLIKIETEYDGKKQEPWRPRAVYHYIQDKDLTPDFLVDVSEYTEKKMQSILAFNSQFYNPESSEPLTYISSPDFLDALKGRMRLWGKIIGVSYAEGFTSNKIIGVEDVLLLM
ncbi:bacillithiol biosynthesis deacetylase BshB1 [Bacteroidota bacterium]|nr:bacillithiol biosynthesis deacetylase BshB1 [Bacteroidota bacterium]